MQKSKIKTLLVLKILEKYSDENTPLSTTDIMAKLHEVGVECERKSLYADFKALNEIGYSIECMYSPKRGFYMSERTFELPEVRLLIDAVTSAGFITPNKTKQLVTKLEGLLSNNQAEALETQVYRDSANKCDNEEIYYIIDNLHTAIKSKNKVTFTYKKRVIDKKNKKSYTSKTFKVSPYALIWRDDHYYLVCNNEKYDNLMNLRLDRMKKLDILEETARDVSEVSEYIGSFDTSDYVSKTFNMFSGSNDTVTIICNLELREEIMDRFGSKIPLEAVDSDHFKTTIKAAVSDGLVSWILQYGDSIRVVSPNYLIEKIKERVDKVSKLY